MPSKLTLIVFLVFFLLSKFSFSQNIVKGQVFEKQNHGKKKGLENQSFSLPFVWIHEWKTENRDTTDIDGKFEFITLSDSSLILFHFIGLESESVIVTKDTSISVYLGLFENNAKWLTAGTSYDFENGVIGFSISNGFDEHPLFHFEDFQDRILMKLGGSTDFRLNYGYNFKLGWDYFLRKIYLPALEFRKFNYVSNEFIFSDLNISFQIFPFPTSKFGSLWFKTGLQELNEEKNYGLGLGWQQAKYIQNINYGIMVGYWRNYFTYNAFFQAFVLKSRLSLRLNFERINAFNQASLGIHYTFSRKIFKKKNGQNEYW